MIFSRHKTIAEHLIAFCGYLRGKNYQVGIDEVSTALLALSQIDISRYDDFIQMLQICLARNKDQWTQLIAHYGEFKKEYGRAINAKIKDEPTQERPNTGGTKKKYQLDDIKKWLFSIENKDLIETPFYSPFHSDEKTFFEFEEEDGIVLDFWIKKLLEKLAVDRRRKKLRNKSRGELDLKQLMRSRFVKGDELVELYFKYPKREKSKIILLCDVSKSMDLYGRFISSVIDSLTKIFDYAAIYYFNTELYDIKTPEQVENVAGLWAGGTRIGHCFDQWLDEVPIWCDKKTKVLIYSDGWDTGDLDLLDRSMYLMRKMVGKIIWLNPVIKNAENIQIAGMRIASKYVDVLAPLYNLKGLKELVRHI